MLTPEPEGLSLLGKIGAALAPIMAVVYGFLRLLGKKADKHVVASQYDEIRVEQGMQRQHIAKLFDKLDEHSRRDEELVREVLGAIAANHSEVLRELGRKADR